MSEDLEDNMEKQVYSIQDTPYRKILPISFSIFTILLFLFLLYNYKSDQVWEEYNGEYKYQIQVSNEGDGEYRLLLPCVIDTNGKINPEMMDNIKIIGNAEVEIVLFNGSYFLEITGSGPQQIISEYSFDTHEDGKSREGFNPTLSTMNITDQHLLGRTLICSVKLFNESTISELDIEFSFEESIEGFLYNGLGQGGSNWGYYGEKNYSGTINKSIENIIILERGECGDSFVGWDFYTPVSVFVIIGISASASCNITLIILNRNIKNNHKYNDKNTVIALYCILIGSLFAVLMEFSLYHTATYYIGKENILNVQQFSGDNNISVILIVGIILIFISFLNIMTFKRNNISTVLFKSESEKHVKISYWLGITSMAVLIIYSICLYSVIQYETNGAFISNILSWGTFVGLWIITAAVALTALIKSIIVKIKIKKGIIDQNKKSTIGLILSIISLLIFILLQFADYNL